MQLGWDLENYKASHTHHIWFTIANWLNGITPSNIKKVLYFVTGPFHMNAQACYFLWHLVRHTKKRGDVKGQSKGNNILNCKALVSHCWVSLFKGQFQKPLRSTISLPDILQVCNCAKNVIDPLEEIPTSAFRVVWFLLELNNSLFNRRLLGISQCTSVQSIITFVLAGILVFESLTHWFVHHFPGCPDIYLA